MRRRGTRTRELSRSLGAWPGSGGFPEPLDARMNNGGFPEPLDGEPVRVVRSAHPSCGAQTRIRLPRSVPVSAVRRVVCEGCRRAYDPHLLEEVRPTFWGDPPPGWAWRRIATVPIAVAALVGALLLLQALDGSSTGEQGTARDRGRGVPLGGAAPAHAEPVSGFEARPIGELRTYQLFDLGVVDFDQDGDLDVFTTNHLSQESLLANDADGEFEDTLSEVGLDQSPGFPGWSDDPNTPADVSDPGLYIFRDHNLILRLTGATPVGGTIEFLAPVQVVESTRADVSVTDDPGSVPPRTRIRFDAEKDARIVLRPEQLALPVDFKIDEPYPPDLVFVGHRKISPDSNGFTLYLRDRHGIAWADYTGDGLIDAYITRGGLKGQVSLYGGLIQDELAVNSGPSFEDRIATTEIVKGACRARGATPVDFDLDARLDLFVACRGGPPQLHRQRPDGTFADLSGALAWGGARGSAFEWVDVRGDRHPELIAARDDGFAVYERRGDLWEEAQLIVGRHASPVTDMTVADYDRDGDFDIFAAAGSGSTLLVNDSGGKPGAPEQLTAVEPSLVGLPNDGALTASWVDYDNDGRHDLHVFPHGLFRQRANHRFRPTGIAGSIKPAAAALTAWFDADGNGTRDALIVTRASEAERDGNVRLLMNQRTENHWLQVELDGPPRNRQALGATVEVEAGGRSHLQWVGQSDDSRFSQGHYRLYFGLGRAEEVQRLTVTWADGSARRLGPFEPDRLLRLGYGPASVAE